MILENYKKVKYQKLLINVSKMDFITPQTILVPPVKRPVSVLINDCTPSRECPLTAIHLMTHFTFPGTLDFQLMPSRNIPKGHTSFGNR